MVYWYVDRSGHRVVLHTFLCISCRDNSLDTVRMRHSQNNFLPRLHCLPRNLQLAVNMTCGVDCCSLLTLPNISLCSEAWVQLYTVVWHLLLQNTVHISWTLKQWPAVEEKCYTADSEASSIIHERWNNSSNSTVVHNDNHMPTVWIY